MTVNHVTTPEDLTFSVDEFFKNIPISFCSEINTTQTYDYEQDCLYVQCNDSLVYPDPDKKIQSILDLYIRLHNYPFIEQLWYNNVLISIEIVEFCNKWGNKKIFVYWN